MNEISNCPWSDYTPGTFPICEEGLCAWIKQPVNAYSNLAFLIVSIYLIYLYLNKKSTFGLSFGICILFIGTASFAAHSSMTQLFGFLDFAAIFSIFSYYAAINTAYLKKIESKKVFNLFLLYFVLSATTLYFFNFLREILFAGFIIGLQMSEYKILKSQGKVYLTTSNKKVLLTFLAGVIFLALDSKKVICDSTNHFFQLHAAWHICDAISLYFLTRHLDQHRS
jgi:hypothetical protein